MRKDKWLICLQSMLLAFVLGYSGVGCIITGFNVERVDMQELTAFCAIAALVCSACFTVKLAFLPACLLGLWAGALWVVGPLNFSMEALLNMLSGRYAMAYQWPRISWSDLDLSQVDMTVSLCAVAAMVVLAISWAVCRRKGIILPVTLACLPVCACAVVTDTVPHWLWLAVFLLGLTVLLISQLLRRKKTAEGNVVSLMSILPTVIALAVLFSAVPQEGYGYFSGGTMAEIISGWVGDLIHTPGEQGQSDVQSDTVNLEQVGSRRESNTVIMEVTTQYNGLLYLRSYAYNTYYTNCWTDERLQYSLPWPELSHLENAPPVTVETVFANPIIYAPYYSEELVAQGNANRIENSDRKKTFTFQLWDADKIDWSNEQLFQPRHEYTELPEKTQQWAQEIVNMIVAKDQYASEIAADIATYVSNCAKYDLNAGRMPSQYDDFAYWFLTQADKGYCVHFATAATILLRAAGVPARYVNGYLVNTQAGETVQVQAKNAHAWVEYYVDGCGWMILEPTPSQVIWEQISVAKPVTDDNQPETTTDAQTEQTTKPDLDPEQTTPAPTKPTQGTAPVGKDTTLLRPVLLAIVWVLIAVAVVLLQWRLRLFLRRRGKNRGKINQKVLCAWSELVYLSKIAGVKPSKELFELAQKAKFSQHILPEESLVLFEKNIEQVIGKLKKRPIYLRLVYRLILAAY